MHVHHHNVEGEKQRNVWYSNTALSFACVHALRANWLDEMKHMFNLIVLRSRIPSQGIDVAIHCNLESLRISMVLLSADDVSQIRRNLVVLVSRILCKYIQYLSSFSDAVTAHIPHAHSVEMARKSEMFVLDVLPKNQAKHCDRIEIMQELQSYLDESFLSSQRVISGDDQLTCERQVCAQCHMTLHIIY